MIRAFQWDLARQVERLDWLLAQLPRYADWGYTQLYLHLEDAVEYPSFPDIARSDAYRLRDLERLAARAAASGIGVVPIVNLLGHTQYLIKTPALRELNELRNPDGTPREAGQICAAHPETPRVAERLIRDVLPLCTAGRVHVGLDESFLLGRHPLSAAEIARCGLEGHFAAHVGRLEGIAAGFGLKLGLWADMLALLPGAIRLLPKGIAAYDWYYYPFDRHPRLELRNFAEYDLVPALARQGIAYWGCPSNGAFRFEPMPVFGDRLANARSWWARCRAVGAEGFLATSWESYRLAQEMTTVVDAAIASLWLDPDVDDHVEMLARGFRRVYGAGRHRELARLALACDERAFAGYARWEINERWDCCVRREGSARAEREARFFERNAARPLPESFGASLRFRRYLAERDAFVRRAAQGVWELRRLLAGGKAGGAKCPFAARLKRLQAEAARFGQHHADGVAAARDMWALSRDSRRRGQNEKILAEDKRRLGRWKRWLEAVARRRELVRRSAPTAGAWQLEFAVHNFAPALQRVVVEERSRSGQWKELRGRYTIEFRAAAARPHARIQRGFCVPVDPIAAAEGRLRIAVRGIGQVAISHVELTDGVSSLHAHHWPQRERRVLGAAAEATGFPTIDMSVNRGEAPLAFDAQRITRARRGTSGGPGQRAPWPT